MTNRTPHREGPPDLSSPRTPSSLWNSVVPLASSLLEHGTYFLVYAILARLMDAPAYGEIVAVFVFANIANALLEAGLASYFQREAAATATAVSRRLRTALTFKGWTMAAQAALCYLYFEATEVTALFNAGTAAAAILFIGLANILTRTLYGLERFREAFMSMLWSRAFVLAGSGALYVLRMPSGSVLLILLMGTILHAMLLGAALRNCGVAVLPVMDRPLLGDILRSSLPMGLGALFVWLYDKSDVLLIRHLLDATSVSYYAIAYTVYKIPQILTGAVLVPLFTRLSGIFARDSVLRYGDITRSAFVLTIAAIFSMSALWWGGGWFIRTVYGETYASASSVTALLLFAVPGVFLNNLTGVALNSVRSERTVMVTTSGAFLVNITANIMLIPSHGIAGAAAATIVTEYGLLLSQGAVMLRSPKFRTVRVHPSAVDEGGV